MALELFFMDGAARGAWEKPRRDKTQRQFLMQPKKQPDKVRFKKGGNGPIDLRRHGKKILGSTDYSAQIFALLLLKPDFILSVNDRNSFYLFRPITKFGKIAVSADIFGRKAEFRCFGT